MWEVLIGLVVQVALLYAGIRIYFWAKRLQNASGSTWRRRVGLVFFLAPILLWVGQLILPEALLLPLQVLVWINDGITWVLQGLLSVVEQSLGGLWLVALKPLCYAVVYGVAGVLVGWPIDVMRQKARGSDDTEEEDDPEGDGGAGGASDDGANRADDVTAV